MSYDPGAQFCVRGRPFDFWGGGIGDLVWVRIFFPKPLELRIFRRHKRFFLALHAMRDIFFSAGIFSPGISLQDFFPRNQSRKFFSEIAHIL